GRSPTPHPSPTRRSSDLDEQEDLRTRIAEAAGEDRGYRVLDLSGDDLLEVRRGQDVAAEGEQGRDRADEDRHEHGLGDASGRVRDLLRSEEHTSELQS